jgi:2-desacetyl-2-hydroxyethyl bacteriochlorophyllide A dehydrogenase
VGWGYSEVGEVVEVANSRSAKADSTAGITVGDVVHGVWGHRSEGVLPTADLEGQVIPPDQDPVIGVFARVGAIALNAVLAADIHVTESVVITGQGVIGLLATRLAVLSGANVIAVDGIAGRRGVAQNFGASDVVDPTTTDVAVRVRELIGSGADVAIELSGAYSALHAAIRSVSPGGRVVAAGFYQGPATGLDLGEEFHHNRVTIVGSQIGGVPAGLDPRWDRARLSRAFLDLVTSGRLDVLPLVTHVVPVDEAATAYRLLDQNPTGVLQVVLDFRSSEGGGAPSTQA